jgi:hypothetical protein
MSTIEIEVVPLRLRPEQQHQTWQAWLGDELLCRSRTPFFSAARALLKRSVDPETKLVMRHRRRLGFRGEDTVTLSSTVGAAAKLTIIERDDPEHRIEPRPGVYREFPVDLKRP